MILKRLLTEFLLYAGVAAPPGLVVARFASMSLPRFVSTETVLGFSTAALLGAFILADYVRQPAAPPRGTRRSRSRSRRSRLMLPAQEVFVTPTPRTRRIPGASIDS